MNVTPWPQQEAAASSGRIRIASGTPKGKIERLYAANLGLVGAALKHFPFLTGEAREEAYGAGLLGLWQAAQRFDASRGVKFSGYATDYIRGHILRFLKQGQRQRRLPTVSLETPMGEDGAGELADLIADPQAERPGQKAVEAAGFEALVSRLPERHRAVLQGVYEREEGLAEIARPLGITRQRCHQIHIQALRMLKSGKAGRGNSARVSV